MRLLISILLLCPTFIFSQALKKEAKKEHKKNIQAYFDYKIFQIPNDTASYIEGYLEFEASKITFRPINGKDLQGQLAIEYELKRGDSVYASKVYKFLTPIMKDSIVENFLENFKIRVEPGIYELKLGLLDVYNSSSDFVYSTQVIEVPKIQHTPYLSDVIIAELLRKSDEESIFNKNGILVYPRIKNFFDAADEKMPYYIEAYNLNNESKYLLMWEIDEAKDNKPMLEFKGIQKLVQGRNQAIIGSIDIQNLPSGEYNLVMKLTGTDLKPLSTKTYFFAKQNDETNDFEVPEEQIIVDPAFQASIKEDSLRYYLGSLYPIVGKHEDANIKAILKNGDLERMRNYMERFWIAMSKKSKNQKPYDLWLTYKGQVDLVQRKFATLNMPGYRTDRGRVYLQYGSPSSIVVQETSPSEYPYEIWFYDKIENYSNRKFIFYSPDLLPNAYQLLHSDMVGEYHNYRWEHDLNKRNSPVHDIDDPNDGNVDHFGGNSSIYYNQH